MKTIDIITSARKLAQKQNQEKIQKEKEHTKSIYNEVMSLLEKQINNEYMHNGYVFIRVDHNYPFSGTEQEGVIMGYCGWNPNIVVWDYEGIKVAEMITVKHRIPCEFIVRNGDNPYFRFDFNERKRNNEND